MPEAEKSADITPTYYHLLSVVSALLLVAMTSIFFCCWGRKNSGEVKDKEQSVKEKSPSPQAEDKNGTPGSDNFVTSSEDLGDFSAVQRETEILRSYRRPQAPRKKGRHSRAPRALTQSQDKLDVFGELAEEDDEQEETASKEAAKPLLSSQGKEEEQGEDRTDGREEETVVTIRDNTDKDRDKRDTRSSMLADIEQTLASLHLQQKDNGETEEKAKEEEKDGDNSGDAEEDEKVKEEEEEKEEKSKLSLSPIKSISSEATGFITAAVATASSTVETTVKDVETKVKDVETKVKDVFAPKSVDEPSSSEKEQVEESDNVEEDKKLGEAEDEEKGDDKEEKVENAKSADEAEGNEKNSDNEALLPPEKPNEKKEKEETKKDVVEEKPDAQDSQKVAATTEDVKETEEAEAKDAASAQQTVMKSDEDHNKENQAPPVAVAASIPIVSSPQTTTKTTDSGADKSPGPALTVAVEDEKSVRPVSEEMTRSTELSLEAAPLSADVKTKSKAKVPPKVSPKPSPKARAAAAAAEALRAEVEQAVSQTPMAGVSSVPSAASLSSGVGASSKDIDSGKTEPAPSALNTTPLRSSLKDSTNSAPSAVQTKIPSSPQHKQPVSGIPTKSGASSKPTSPVGTSPLREKPSVSIAALGKTIPTSPKADISSRPTKTVEDSNSSLSALASKPQEKALPKTGTDASAQQQRGNTQVTEDESAGKTSPAISAKPPSEQSAELLEKDSRVNGSEVKVDKPTSLALSGTEHSGNDKTGEETSLVESPSDSTDGSGRQRRESEESKGKHSKIPVRGGSKSRSSPPKTPKEEKADTPESPK